MALNCGCPGAASLTYVQDNATCKQTFGQVQKIIFQRLYKTVQNVTSLNDITGDPLLKATWTPFFSASDDTKMIITPYVQNPTTEAGAARKFGGGNQTLGGIEITLGSEPTTFTSVIYQEDATTVIKPLKTLMCENLGVYFVDENGNIAAQRIATTSGGSTTYTYQPFPISDLFVGDRKLGGYEEPDSNALEFSLRPNWSDLFYVIDPTDFNPLTDLHNAQ